MTELTKRIEELKSVAPESAKELLEQIEQLSSDSYTEKEVEDLVLQFDPVEIKEDTQEWQDFRDLQHDIVSYFNAEVEIVTIGVYEKDNGFEIEAIENGETYKVYAQFPNCSESEHSFLSDHTDQRILNKIIEAADSMHSNTDYAFWSKLGSICDYEYKEITTNYEYYVVVEKGDVENYFFAKESRYSDYYNVFMISELDEHDLEDEELMEKLNSLLKELQNQ